MKQVFSFICNVCAADTLVVQKVTLCGHMHTVINNGEHADICTGVTKTLLDSGKCQHLFETPLQPRGSRTFGLAPTYCWSFLWHVLTINMRITANQSSCTVQTHRICALWMNIVKVIRVVLGEMEVFTINMIPVNNFQWKTCFSSMRDCFYSQLIESFITWCNSNPTRSTNELVLVYCCICECVNYVESQIPCMCSRVWLIKHQILKCGSFTHMFDPAAQTISTISTV